MNALTAVHPSLSRLFSAEWLKLRTMRSSWICAVAAVVAAIGGAVVQGLGYAGPELAEGLTAREAAADVLSSSSAVLQIAIIALAVLALGSEYTGGAIRVTFVAAPRRLRLMAAKALVVAVVSTILSALTLGLGLAAALPLLSRTSLTGVPFGTMLALLGVEIGYCLLVALLAFAVTLAVRSTAGGISLTLGVVLLLRVVVVVLDVGTKADLTSLTFPVAAMRVMTDPLSPALPVVVAWVAIPAVLGSLTLVRRDA